MSYSENIGNRTVRFKEEIDYLNCRIDYLEFSKNCEDSANDMLSFLGFIQSEMYDKNICEVESIDNPMVTPISITSAPLGPSPSFYDTFNNFAQSISGTFAIPEGP